MKKIGISIYPEFESIQSMKDKIDDALQLGYQIVFTSMQLNELGFENTQGDNWDKFTFLFEYCHQNNMEIHADINDKMLSYLNASCQNLYPIYERHIHVLRIDSGFSDEQVSLMTQNEWGILIEENASMLQYPQRRIKQVVEQGNIHQYCACHNFFPLNETGLSWQEAIEQARLFKKYGIQVGIFIGSLYSPKDLNAIGRGVVTIERHRYVPSYIQANEIFVHSEYDYVIFGDSQPSELELRQVSEAAHYDELEWLQERYDTKMIEEDLTDLYCIQLPIWLDQQLDPQLKQKLLSTVFLARCDQSELVIRATQLRNCCDIVKYHPIERNQGVITLHNHLANRYQGELQIVLEDRPSLEWINVIGQVKPMAKYLLEEIKGGKALFVLKEE